MSKPVFTAGRVNVATLHKTQSCCHFQSPWSPVMLCKAVNVTAVKQTLANIFHALSSFDAWMDSLCLLTIAQRKVGFAKAAALHIR